MTARPVKSKDPLQAVCLSTSGGKCQAAKRLQFGATDMHGTREEAIIDRCGKPMEGVFYEENGTEMMTLCHDCRLRILGLTSSEKRKRTMANKAKQMYLTVKEDKK